jgi:tetratricopeptide (TPR) repeat protein
MAKQNYKYASDGEITAAQWMEKLWYLYSQKLNIINLLAERVQERELLETLGKLLLRIDRNDHQIDFLIMQVRHFSVIGDLNKAEELADRLLEVIEADTDKNIIRQAYEWRALIAREKTLTRQALQYYQEAEKHADSDLARAGIWLDKGLTLVYGNQLQPAESLLRQAITVYERFNSVDILGDAYNNLGICLRGQNRTAETIQAYASAVKHYDRAGYKLGSAVVSGNVSEMYWHQGDYDRAFALARRCLELGREAEDLISVGLGNEMMGQMYVDLADYHKGIEHLRASIAAVREVNDRPTEAVTNGYLAHCYSLMDCPGDAERHLDLALEIGREIEETELSARLELVRLRVLSCLRPPGEAVELIDRYLCRDGRALRKNDRCLLLYGKMRALARQGRWPEAREEYITLKTELSEIVHKSFALQVHSLGHQIFTALGEPGRAGEQREIARQLLDEILKHLTDNSLRNCFLSKGEVMSIREPG